MLWKVAGWVINSILPAERLHKATSSRVVRNLGDRRPAVRVGIFFTRNLSSEFQKQARVEINKLLNTANIENTVNTARILFSMFL